MVKLGLIQTTSQSTNQKGISHIVKILKKLGRSNTDIVCLPEQWLKNNEISNFDLEFLEFKKIAKELDKGGVDCRPLICGSIGNQPYWIKLYGKQSFKFADKVDNYGLYVPNNPSIGLKEVEYISDIINKNT